MLQRLKGPLKMPDIKAPALFKSPAVGLDIDRGAIKAVQVSQSGGAYTLQHVGYRKLPVGAIADGEVGDHDLLAAELKKFWDSH